MNAKQLPQDYVPYLMKNILAYNVRNVAIVIWPTTSIVSLFPAIYKYDGLWL